MTRSEAAAIDWNAEFEERASLMIGDLRSLVELESPSRDPEAIRPVALAVSKMLAASGASVDIVEEHANGPNIVAKFGKGERPVLILGHLDTVWKRGTLASMPWRIEDGRAYGPGVLDMKSGLVIVAEALNGLRRHDIAVPVTVVFNCDEEIGSESTRSLVAEQAQNARAALVFEPAITGGAAKTSRSGIAAYRIHVRGRASHAGVDPEKGVSAILEAARIVVELHAMNDLSSGLSVNAGIIEGGTRANVVAAEARMDVDVRFRTSDQAIRIVDAISGLAGARGGALVTVAGGIDRPPFEATPESLELFARAAAAARESGFELGRGHVGGVSDGNFTAALGIPTLDGLGPDGAGAHADHEHIVIADLSRRAAMLTRLLIDIGGDRQ
ncbi:MAG: M20 family metallopeptidase [Acidobacteria bacterium]|nr:M20 family metallopeptidase [Acidobacteriota bacterium]